MSRFRIVLEVQEDEFNPAPWTAEILDHAIQDILKKVTLPTFNLDLNASYVTKMRD